MLGRALVPFVSAAALATALVAGAPSRADVYDVRVGVEGARAEIDIEFDATPTASFAAPGGSGLMVFAAGVAARPRRIETAAAGLLRGLDVRQGEGGVELTLDLGADAASASTMIEGRTLHVAVTLATAWSDVDDAAAMAAAPRAAPRAAPTTPVAAAEMASAEPPNAPATAPSAAPAEEASPAGEAPSGAGLRLGGEDGARAGLAMSSDGAGTADPAAAPTPGTMTPGTTTPGTTTPSVRDPSRPSVIVAGGLTDADCAAAEAAAREDAWDLDAVKRYAACRALVGDQETAETVYRRLLTFAPDDVDAELGLAAIRQEQGRVAEAAAVYQRLLEDAAGDAEAARLRALMALAGAGAGN